MRISDWSSDVCSSDLVEVGHEADEDGQEAHEHDNSGGPDDLVTQLASSLAFLRNLLGLFGQKVNQPLRRPQQAPVVAAPPDELQAHRQAAFGLQQRQGNRRQTTERPDRSEERRVGKGCVSTGSVRGWPDPSKTNYT